MPMQKLLKHVVRLRIAVDRSQPKLKRGVYLISSQSMPRSGVVALQRAGGGDVSSGSIKSHAAGLAGTANVTLFPDVTNGDPELAGAAERR
jgi:hypothetical protein